MWFKFVTTKTKKFLFPHTKMVHNKSKYCFDNLRKPVSHLKMTTEKR